MKTLKDFTRALLDKLFPAVPPPQPPTYADEVEAAIERLRNIYVPGDPPTIIHCPKIGCPADYDRYPALFSRRGESFDACVRNGGGPLSIDFLLAGEACNLDVVWPGFGKVEK